MYVNTGSQLQSGELVNDNIAPCDAMVRSCNINDKM